MFVLFTDVDGVLVTWETIATPEYRATHEVFSKDCVEAFNLFSEIPDCKIVVSSSWRIGRDTKNLQELFARNGVTIPVIDKTERLRDGIRGLEILKWISDNNYTGEYLVIDDEMFDISPHIADNKLVEIKDGLRTKGLTKEIVRRVLGGIREVLNYNVNERSSKMCTPNTMHAIETVIGELTGMRRSFTGRDVYDRMHNKHVRRDEDFSGCAEGPQEVSRDVRKLFNERHPAFENYGSALVYHDNGPVLFFALPYHAKVKASKIKQQLDD